MGATDRQDMKNLLNDFKFSMQKLHDSNESVRRKGGPLLKQVIGSRLDRYQLEKLRDQRLARLRHGEPYGALTVNVKSKKRTRAGHAYKCQCKCGNEVWLTTREVHHRAELEAGCMAPECPYGGLEAKLWFNPKFALWAQLNFLLSNRPWLVTNDWGGSAYEDINRATPDEGQARFLQYAWPMVEPHLGERAWWIHRFNTALPYAPGNIVFDHVPDPEVVEYSPDRVRYGGTLYSLEDLAEMFNVPIERVRTLRRTILSDAGLMDKLIEEGET